MKQSGKYSKFLQLVANEAPIKNMLVSLIQSEEYYSQLIVSWHVLFPKSGEDSTKKFLTKAVTTYNSRIEDPRRVPLSHLLETAASLLSPILTLTVPLLCDSANVTNILPTKFSDVTLSVGEFKIPCHRAFLSSQSDFFDLLFNSPMQESREPEVAIGEIEPKLLEKVCLLFWFGWPLVG